MNFQRGPNTEVLRFLHLSLVFFSLLFYKLRVGSPPSPFLPRFFFHKKMEQKLEYLNKLKNKQNTMHGLLSLFVG